MWDEANQKARPSGPPPRGVEPYVVDDGWFKPRAVTTQ